MINRIYRLVDTKRIELVQREVDFDCGVILKPDYVAVCKADQRYYQGKRNREIMRSKLPMALIHEATATVMHDNTGEFLPGTKAVLIPLVSPIHTSDVKNNYNTESKFMSSGHDGFLCDYTIVRQEQVIPIKSNYSVIYVFSEIISVVFNAVETFEKSCVTDISTFGVWGDGSMGFVTALVLRCIYPESKIFVFGKTARRLQRFSFADELFYVDDVPSDVIVNHAFECVGGSSSESAVRQIIQLISPQGCVSLLGVTEDEISINTRTILDKGLKILGNNRSGITDFVKAAALIQNNDICKKYLETLISEVVEINNERDIAKLFEQDILNDFKTVGRWRL